MTGVIFTRLAGGKENRQNGKWRCNQIWRASLLKHWPMCYGPYIPAFNIVWGVCNRGNVVGKDKIGRDSQQRWKIGMGSNEKKVVCEKIVTKVTTSCRLSSGVLPIIMQPVSHLNSIWCRLLWLLELKKRFINLMLSTALFFVYEKNRSYSGKETFFLN